MTQLPDSQGTVHLRWIWRFQLILLPVGALAWAIRSIFLSGSFWSTAVFVAGGLASMTTWQFHQWAVGKLLSPSVKRRWFFGLVGIFKLALIVILLRVIVVYFPKEVFPLVTGLLLFVAAILMEAVRLVFGHFRSGSDDGNQL